MHLLSLLLVAFSGLVVSVPQHGANLFRPEPRANHLDWNAPRGHSTFLMKRSNLLSEEYFNNPPVKRSPDTSPAHPVVPLTKSSLSDRATSGQWENLEGSSTWNPTPASWGGSRQDVYYVHKDRTCKYRTYDGGKWGGWQDIGGSFDSPAAACSRKKENMHIFCKGTDGQAWHRAYDSGSGSGGWGPWQGMGGSVKHYPSACSWGKDHVSVYVSSSDGECWHRRYDDGQKGWYGWENMGGYLDGPPKAVTWGQGHTSVFCKGQDGQAWHRKYESGWGQWESLGGTLDGEPAACAWDGRMDVFVKGSDGACWHKTYKRGTGWGGWENMGGKIKGGKAPDVVYYGGKMEVYITGDDNALYRKVWKDDKWTSDWENMGGSMYTKPNAVTWDDGKMDVYGSGSDGSCRRCY
ncbi:hypothetical protein CHGG_04436 [Chaetomium globosum CBS 148.51]|uniref:PLL-like beta propeller domain-containing protein n=1 Tax=Chaetomium globosum (strain ATCC 6205 / CBS 148.51 / DSM 1962 / NBRC 6347 / NRRL 1970) TaxID=306901 RepID=Q2H1B0_CHAGB|nr:uncharacterized protein CHGG_04436 [Chaetomium globosum CBS 148.51]EAQ87817.1 hypothetical protein CHGG_04436 [Chaetomium globosum CBS 148.51]